MKSALTRILKASRKLQVSYSRGDIPYPRTDWDYIKEKPFAFHAHPPIPNFDEYSLPLSFSDYPFIKETMPLELTNAGIASASTVQRITVMIDTFYDDDMNPNPFKKKELQKSLEGFYKHIEELHDIYGEDVIGGANGEPIKYENIMPDKDTARMKMRIVPYRIELTPSPRRVQKIKKINEDKNKKLRDDIGNFTDLEKEIITVDNIEHAVKDFKKRLMGINFLKKQREMILKQKMQDSQRVNKIIN